MTPQTAQWYLEIVKAYLEDPQKAQSKYQLSPSLLKDVFKDALGTDDFNQVKNLLEGILGGKALGQNIPNPDLLKYWEEEYERVQLQKRKITNDVIKEIRNNIKQRQAMALQIHKIMEAERNKPEIKEIDEKPEYVQQSFDDLTFELKDKLPSVIHQWATAKITPTTEEYTDTIFNFALEISKRRELLGFNRERLANISQNLAEGTYETATKFIDSSQPVSAPSDIEQKEIKEEPTVPVVSPPFSIPFGKNPQTETEPAQRTASATAVAEKPQASTPISVLERQLEEKEESLQMAETKKLSATDELRQRIGYKESEGVIFVPILSVISPTLAWALFKKTALAPVVKPLQAIDLIAGENLQGDGVSEWHDMLHHGKSSSDLDTTLSAMQEEGKINYDDPRLRGLENEKAQMQAYEQTHPKMNWLLKNYHEFSKLTGNQKVASTTLGANLPKLNPSTWVSSLGKHSYSLHLKRALDRIGGQLFFAYDKKVGEYGQNKLLFVPQDKLVRFFTFGKVESWYTVRSWATRHFIQPMLAGLSKTAFGQGIKKFGAGLLARLGVKMGVRAAAAAAAPETLGLSLLIGAALELLGKLLGKFAPAIKKFSTFLIGAALGLAGLAIGLPLGIPLLAASAFLMGTSVLGPSFALGVVGSVGGAIGSVVSTITGILVAITAPIAGTVSAAFIVGGLAILGGTTFFIVTLTASAFSGFPPLARSPGDTQPPPPSSEFIELEKHVLIGGTQLDPPRVDNNVVDQKFPAAYTITLRVKDKTLTNLVVTDTLTVTNKDGNFNITQDADGQQIGPWNSTNESQLAKMDPGSTWTKTFTIKLDDRQRPDNQKYKDSTFTNVVSVTSAEGESAYTSRTFMIGTALAGSCPLKGGGPITCGSYTSPTQGCHGTNSYWAGNPPACSYPIGGYLGPNDPNSTCYTTCKNANNCGPGYGFAVDVAGSTGQEVVFPSINGENITWDTSWAGPCGLDGCGTNYKGKDSKGNTYWLYVTHLQSQGVVIGPPKQSGDTIGYLKDLSSRGGTHLHYELAINGVTVRPEFLCQ